MLPTWQIVGGLHVLRVKAGIARNDDDDDDEIYCASGGMVPSFGHLHRVLYSTRTTVDGGGSIYSRNNNACPQFQSSQTWWPCTRLRLPFTISSSFSNRCKNRRQLKVEKQNFRNKIIRINFSKNARLIFVIVRK